MKNKQLEKAIKDIGVQNLIEDHGFSKATIYAAMSGRRKLGLDMARRLAEVLGVHKSICRPDVWD